MSIYYNGNAIYDFISSAKRLVYSSPDLWMLIYGNNLIEPKVILLLSQYTNSNYFSDKLSSTESEMLNYVKQISYNSKIPYLYVRFNGELENLNEVIVLLNDELKTIKIEEYLNLLINFGLNKNGKKMRKKINSKFSNIYHLWQSKSGLDLTTSDIDLIRLDSNSNIKSVYELKRSYIPIDAWKPYVEDYNNFILMSKVFRACGINFYILFNQYTKDPFAEDIKYLKIYKVIYEKNLKIDLVGKFEMFDFLNEISKY